MSFMITLYVREGIVMASDSRLTLKAERREGDKRIVQLAIGQSDSSYKIFLTPDNVGIATFGAADVQGVPIGGYIESFMNEHLGRGNYEIDEIPRQIYEYFSALPQPPASGFIIGGYKVVDSRAEQHIWEVLIKAGQVRRINENGRQGALWRGETDVLTRLVQPVALKDQSGEFKPLPHHPIQWGFFTLQDAVDYAIYAVRVTLDTMRFHPRPKTVGGPIDVLVIKPDQAQWVQRKTLHA
ncbi:MAG TPA: hypothetical protein ENI95_02550 [Chloroflexi bacterium]|nr:hypothetical protein [Chloroflexota bacterium]